MTFDLYIRMLRNCLAYFSQNPQIRNWCINWWELCSLAVHYFLRVFLSVYFLFCLPDMCACAIFRKNQIKYKPSIFTQHWHWLIHLLSFRVGRSFWRRWKAVHTDLVGKFASKASINRTLNELYSCNDMQTPWWSCRRTYNLGHIHQCSSRKSWILDRQFRHD